MWPPGGGYLPLPELLPSTRTPALTTLAGCPGSGINGSVCTCCGTHCGILVVVNRQETAFSHVSLSPAAADR